MFISGKLVYIFKPDQKKKKDNSNYSGFSGTLFSGEIIRKKICN